ncbi:MAG TPA: ATP synthase subunit I [Terriglobales bacterium]|nr:ATP synthase subunit I [Terriglobales bacterium]
MKAESSEPAAQVTRGQAFAEGAERRIRRCFVVIAAALEIAALALRHWSMASGFAVGAVAAFASMVHLQRVVYAFTARAAGEGNDEPAAATVMRFLMRLALLTLGAYVVFRISRPAAYGYIAALFLPVAAMVAEAVYEAWFAISDPT